MFELKNFSIEIIFYQNLTGKFWTKRENFQKNGWFAWLNYFDQSEILMESSFMSQETNFSFWKLQSL